MTRVDLYTSVHKGLRALLFEACKQVATCDFSSADEVRPVVLGLARVVAFLDEHAAHEDRAILAALREHCPELAADLEREHVGLEGRQRELLRLAGRLSAAPQAERLALGRRIYSDLALLTVDHLRHMGREETEANRILWAHLCDDELRAIEGRIVSDIEPARMAEWLEVLLPAMSTSERAELLGGMHGGMPVDDFETLTALGRLALGEGEWRAATTAAGI